MSLLKALFFASLLVGTLPLQGAEGLPVEADQSELVTPAVPASRAPEPHTALLAGLGGLVLLLVAMRRK